MFGGTKFQRVCRSKQLPTSLPDAVASLSLFCGAGILDDPALWPGGNGRETDAAIFEAGSYCFYRAYRWFVITADIQGLVGTNVIPTDDLRARATLSFKQATHIMVAKYVRYSKVDEAATRAHFAALAKQYVETDDALDQFVASLRAKSSRGERESDPLAPFTRGLFASVMQSTIIPGAIQSVANAVRMHVENRAPWQ